MIWIGITLGCIIAKLFTDFNDEKQKIVSLPEE